MDLDPASQVEKDLIIMVDVEQCVELDEVEGVPLREPVSTMGVTSARLPLQRSSSGV